jgi:hypothetical protein
LNEKCALELIYLKYINEYISQEIVHTTLNKDIQPTYKIRLDITPYLNTFVVYNIVFKPVQEGLHDPLDNTRLYYTFGYTKNIKQRMSAYTSSKQYIEPKIIACFYYKYKMQMHDSEMRFKHIVKDIGLYVGYFNKIECYKANEVELKIIYDEMDKHNDLYKTL